jgi:hypothetical protein
MKPDRVERILKMICAGLALLILAKLPGLGNAPDYLDQVVVPSLNSLEPGKPEASKEKTGGTAPSRTSRPSSPPLPDHIKARVDAVYQSEVFGPVARPLPMEALGIIGDDVILRAPNGQTGLVSVGETLGGIKILEVGINRVLIEEDGQKKELRLHNGFGGDSLIKP